MGVVQLRQIRNLITQQYVPHVDMADYVGRSPADLASGQLTRGLAAFALATEADLEPDVACAALTDGFDDNGIDAIYYAPPEKTLYICQSKWSHDGTGSIDAAGTMKFTRGVIDLLNLDFARFNSKVRKRSAEIDSAINNAQKIVLIIAYSGSDTLGDHPRRAIDDCLAELNDTGEVASFSLLKQDDLYRTVAQGGRGEPINVSVQLYEWGQTRAPFQAFYGQVAASDVASWGTEYRQRIFSKNIRAFLGKSTAVNEGIAETIRVAPVHFWYLNNGVTVLCGSVRRRAVGGASRDAGTFDCTDVSIVNGAQTVGVLTELATTHSDQLAAARVPIRLISLEDCPAGFSMDVTRATNTQNRVDSRNFVALDPEQERLRTELLVDGIEYEFRQGDNEPVGASRFGLVDATVALACANTTSDLAVQAKREISKLWEDITKAPYKALFNPGLTGLKLWHLVRLQRAIDGSLETEKSGSMAAKRRATATHGNRLIAHLVFQKIGTSSAGKPEFEIDTANLADAVKSALDEVTKAAEEEFGDSYLASLFKNASKCRDIVRRIRTT